MATSIVVTVQDHLVEELARGEGELTAMIMVCDPTRRRLGAP
jgi:hypothetical protein